MLHHIAFNTPALPLLAMIAAGIIGNKLFDRGVRLSTGSFVVVGVLFVGSIVGDAVTLNATKWLLLASLSTTFATMAFALTAGRDELGLSDHRSS